jgi:CheY-like chemotaxis protein
MSRHSVLIIDDDSDFVDEVSELLSNAGYSTISASGHEEAMDKARNERPDIVILDIKFAGNGIKTAEELDGGEETSGIPLIVVSGHVDEKLNSELREKTQVKDVLEKTVLPLDLIASIENNLND